MILNIDEQITDGVFNMIINAYNAIGDTEELVIYMRSEGGDYDVSCAIIELINSHPFELTHIKAYGLVGSSAFDIFLKTNCRKTLIGQCVGVAHQVSVPINYGHSGEPVTPKDKFWKENISENIRESVDRFHISIGLTNEELGYIESGGDLYLDCNRMADILTNIEIVKDC